MCVTNAITKLLFQDSLVRYNKKASSIWVQGRGYSMGWKRKGSNIPYLLLLGGCYFLSNYRSGTCSER